jgi:hypothetical protein
VKPSRFFGKLDAVVRQDGVDLIGNGGDELVEKLSRRDGGRLRLQPGEGVLRGPVHGHEEVELALLGADLGDVDVEVAERVALEGLLGGLVAKGLGQPADAVPLEAAVQG